MPALKRPRHEEFARAYVRGEHANNATACYNAVYGKPSRSSGHRLRHRGDIQQRMDELVAHNAQIDAQATERAVARLAITRETVLGELARIAFANLRDYVGPGGEVVTDLSQLDHDKAAAIQAATVDTTKVKNGETLKRVRIKLAGKHAALIALGRHLGLFVDGRHPIVEQQDTPDEDLVSRTRDIIAALLDAGIDLGVVARVRNDFAEAVAPGGPQAALPLPAVPEAADVPRGGGDA